MPFRLPRSRRAHRVVARTVGLAASTLLAAAMIAWSPQVVSGWNQGAGEATLWQLLNGARVNNGMGPLQQHATLVSLARWRSKDMIQRDYFAHEILGSGCQVYCWYDSNGLSYVWAGENIGWNSGLADNQSAVAVPRTKNRPVARVSTAANPAARSAAAISAGERNTLMIVNDRPSSRRRTLRSSAGAG